jgi:uncharacterized protein with PIN domain
MDCPYCDGEVEAPEESNESGVPYENECPHCGKNFIFYIEWWPSYSPSKAPCLNGKPHNYIPIIGVPKEYFENKRRCSYCADEITLAKEAQ